MFRGRSTKNFATLGSSAPRIVCEPRPWTEAVDVVGPICESSDYLVRDRAMRCPQVGDLLALRGAGAYGFTMSSQYNSRPRAAEVLLEDGAVRLIRRRETMADLLAPELEVRGSPPERLSPP